MLGYRPLPAPAGLQGRERKRGINANAGAQGCPTNTYCSLGKSAATTTSVQRDGVACVCVHVVARRDGATHACGLWANKLLWCFRESLTAFLLLPAAPRCHSLLLGTTSCRCRCFEGVRSAPSSVQARAGLSLVSGGSIPPLLASHWSEAALTHARWPIIGDRQFHPAPAGLSLVNGISGPPLASDW